MKTYKELTFYLTLQRKYFVLLCIWMKLSTKLEEKEEQMIQTLEHMHDSRYREKEERRSKGSEVYSLTCSHPLQHVDNPLETSCNFSCYIP